MQRTMTDSEKAKPHESLEGLNLPGGWTVGQRIRKSKCSTGGHFSCGYLVEHADGRKGYLKALDFFSMLPQSADPARALEPLIKAFNFERDILETCRERRLSRIVSALDNGAVTPPGFPPPATVQYIIFELASGDARKLIAAAEGYDLVLALSTLHEIAAGLRQLHGIGVAHQDLKPSNVLLFKELRLSKIGDLGRAAARGAEPPHYAMHPAGDYGYAPPETLYGGELGSWETRRLGCDIYHLGSMICSLVTTIGMTPLMMMGLEPALRWRNWKGSFEDALDFLYPAFADAVEYVGDEIPKELRTDVTSLLRQLCDPNPTKRGHPLNARSGGGNAFSLERYITRFDFLAKKAQLAFRKAS